MAKFAKLNSIADRAMARMDELGDDAIQAMRNTPRALAAQAANREKARKVSAKKDAAITARMNEKLAPFGLTIGQSVRTLNGSVSEIAHWDGFRLRLANGFLTTPRQIVAA